MLAWICGLQQPVLSAWSHVFGQVRPYQHYVQRHVLSTAAAAAAGNSSTSRRYKLTQKKKKTKDACSYVSAAVERSSMPAGRAHCANTQRSDSTRATHLRVACVTKPQYIDSAASTRASAPPQCL